MKFFKESVSDNLSFEWSQERKESQVNTFQVSEQEGVPGLFVQLSHFTAMEIEAPKDKASDKPSSPAFQAWASSMTPTLPSLHERNTEHECECVVPQVLVITKDGTANSAPPSPRATFMCVGEHFQLVQ